MILFIGKKMKNLFLIGGTMGVGKTAVSRALQKELNNCIFLDGDWCWNASPFIVNEETKAMVIDNICHLLNSFLRCQAYENVVFCWVMHERQIIDDILKNLDTSMCKVWAISLIADEKTVTERLEKDIKLGIRQKDVLARSLAKIPLYEKLDTLKVPACGATAEEIAQKIISLCRDKS